MVRAMCGVQLKDRKKANDLMSMVGLNESIDQQAMVNCVCCYGYLLIRDEVHVLRMALGLAAKGQGKIGRLKRTLRKQVEEESVNVGFNRDDALCQSK